jgi:hypothetical protein
MAHKIKKFDLATFKAVDGAPEGTFEAIVAVFNNVDRGGDRILPGAFKRTLAEWEASGAPIPVVFSHEWDNLDAFIGEVAKAEEWAPGDERLPEAVREYGGLYVKGQLDLDEEFAARVWKKMSRGILRQFSFAYDVADGKERAGVYELEDLDLFEVGPCLVGMNPDTQLMGTKEGRRNSSKDMALIQKIHDLTVELGAKCAGAEEQVSDDGEDEADGKPAGKSSAGSTLATRVALELLEAGVK